jgi:hypothetical protein
MKKLILAAFLAAPLLVLQPHKARAECDCWDLAKWLRNHFCACWSQHYGHGLAHGCGGNGCGNCGHHGCGCGCGCGILGMFGCSSEVPGPWYLYFPYNGQTQEIAGYGPAWPGGWNYEYHFRVPAPAGDWFPDMAPIAPAPPGYAFAAPADLNLAPVPPPPPAATIHTPPGVSTVSDQ